MLTVIGSCYYAIFRYAIFRYIQINTTRPLVAYILSRIISIIISQEAREAYRTDRANSETDVSVAYLSCDLQKVKMLPELPGVKTCVFTKRIAAYNETFSPVGVYDRYNLTVTTDMQLFSLKLINFKI